MTMALEKVMLPGSGCLIHATNSYGDRILTYAALNILYLIRHLARIGTCLKK